MSASGRETPLTVRFAPHFAACGLADSGRDAMSANDPLRSLRDTRLGKGLSHGRPHAREILLHSSLARLEGTLCDQGHLGYVRLAN